MAHKGGRCELPTAMDDACPSGPASAADGSAKHTIGAMPPHLARKTPGSLTGLTPWSLVFAVAIVVTQIGSLGWEHVVDENTFTVIAAHVLDGNLPYVQLYDIKPPVIFLLLAGAMALFGESLLVVRAVGDLFLLASCIAVFAIARRQIGQAPAGLGALMLIAIHAVYFGQPTYTEVPATAMLMAALWLLLARRERLWGLAAAGLLLSLATLTRTNLGIVAAALSVWLAIAAWRRPKCGIRPLGVALFAAVSMVPPGLLALLYWQADALAVFYLANVATPIGYQSQDGMWDILLQLAGWFEGTTRQMPLSYLPFFVTLAAGLAASALAPSHGAKRWLARWPALVRASEAAHSSGAAHSIGGREEPSTNADNQLLWLALIATLLAVLANGRLYGHSLLQLYPICAVFCALGIGWISSVPYLRWPGCLLPAIALAGAVKHTAPDAVRLVTAPEHLSKLHEIRAGAQAVAAVRRPHDTIYAFRYQLIYWYLDMMPVSPVVHPTNLRKPSIMRPLAAGGYVAEDELRRILDLGPTWLVTAQRQDTPGPVPGYFDGDDAALLLDLLARDYQLFYEGGSQWRRIMIYRRY